MGYLGGAHTSGIAQAKQVCSEPWYDDGWQWYLVPKKKYAGRIANACIRACKNNHIGYSQGQRYTLEHEYYSNGEDWDKIKSACYTDCSALVYLCIKIAVKDRNCVETGTTSTLKNDAQGVLKKYFEKVIKATGSEPEVRGTIVLNPGTHTEIYLGDDDSAMDEIISPFIFDDGWSDSTKLPSNISTAGLEKINSSSEMLEGTITTLLWKKYGEENSDKWRKVHFSDKITASISGEGIGTVSANGVTITSEMFTLAAKIASLLWSYKVNKKHIFKNKYAIAGILGNIYQESRFVINSEGSGGFGFVGWTFAPLQALVKQKIQEWYHTSWSSSWEGQAKFIAWSLYYLDASKGYSYRACLDQLNKATSAANAAMIFHDYYEKSAGGGLSNRPAAAKIFYEKLCKKLPTHK